MYLSQRAQSLQESAIRKLDSAMRSYTDVSFFRLNIGQPDIETHPKIRQTIQNWDVSVLPMVQLPEQSNVEKRLRSIIKHGSPTFEKSTLQSQREAQKHFCLPLPPSVIPVTKSLFSLPTIPTTMDSLRLPEHMFVPSKPISKMDLPSQ